MDEESSSSCCGDSNSNSSSSNALSCASTPSLSREDTKNEEDKEEEDRNRAGMVWRGGENNIGPAVDVGEGLSVQRPSFDTDMVQMADDIDSLDDDETAPLLSTASRAETSMQCSYYMPGGVVGGDDTNRPEEQAHAHMESKRELKSLGLYADARLVWIALALITVYLAIGCVFFAEKHNALAVEDNHETQSFVDAFYFTTVTLSTVRMQSISHHTTHHTTPHTHTHTHTTPHHTMPTRTHTRTHAHNVHGPNRCAYPA